MRILPDNPNIDFLRKEAKDLLDALRESRPDATLADAQRALADQYGLRDWPTLKAETERRVSSAPTAPKGLAAELATAFDLGRVTGAATPVSFTPMGRCWSITTDRGRWLAVTVYGWITHEQAEIGARLRDAAAAAGIVAPTPVRSPAGRLIETIRGDNWRVHEWIEVGPSPVTPTPSAVGRQVGSIYGTLHALAIPSQTPINPYLTARRPHGDWAHLVERATAAGKQWTPQLRDTLPALADVRTVRADLDSTPAILCNCNLIPENVRTGRDDALVITEWDFAGSLTPELELGQALMHWVTAPTINRSTIAAFKAGYAEAAGAWPHLDESSFAVAISGWLNWTYNTLCEAIDPSDGDNAAFAEREAATLLQRPMTRQSIHELLAAVDA